MVERGVMYSMKGVATDSGRTRWFGRNLSASALGVLSVWMKMVRRACGVDSGRRGRRGRVVIGERELRAAVWACRDAAPAPGWGRRRLAVAGRKEADRGALEARGARPRRSLVDGMAGCAQSAVGGDGVEMGSWVVGAGVVVVVGS